MSTQDYMWLCDMTCSFTCVYCLDTTPIKSNIKRVCLYGAYEIKNQKNMLTNQLQSSENLPYIVCQWTLISKLPIMSIHNQKTKCQRQVFKTSLHTKWQTRLLGILKSMLCIGMYDRLIRERLPNDGTRDMLYFLIVLYHQSNQLRSKLFTGSWSNPDMDDDYLPQVLT